jgi:hypothetical protein
MFSRSAGGAAMTRLFRRSIRGAAGPGILLTLAGLAGCGIPFPVPPGPWNWHNRWDGVVGPAASSAPIRVGVSDRERVRAVLGEPTVRDPGNVAGSSWRYERNAVVGFTAIDVPFHTEGFVNGIYRVDRLALWFGPDDRLKDYETWSEGGRIVYSSEPDPLPPKVSAEEQRLREESDRVANVTPHPPASGRSSGSDHCNDGK